MNPCLRADSPEVAQQQATRLGFPVVLKTAAPGIAHKSEHGGVHLNLKDNEAVARAYATLERLDRRVLVAPMVEEGIEMLLGMRRDPQFGPVIVVGFGGTHTEALGDVVCGLPPLDPAAVTRLLGRLRLRKLLDARRGGAPLAMEQFRAAVAAFSSFAIAAADAVEEAEVNPIMITPERCIGLDALIVTSQENCTS